MSMRSHTIEASLPFAGITTGGIGRPNTIRSRSEFARKRFAYLVRGQEFKDSCSCAGVAAWEPVSSLRENPAHVVMH